jgi:hypothetical protein
LEQQFSRRHFFKLTGFAALAMTVGSTVAIWGQRVWAEALKLVDMSKKKRTDPANLTGAGILAGMGYVENADAGEKAGKIKRADKPLPSGKGVMPAKSQYCHNCFFIDDQHVNSKEPGMCKLATTVLVHSNGYCNTYTVNPKAKV